MQGKEGSNILETNSQPKGPILQLRNSINFNDELFVSIINFTILRTPSSPNSPSHIRNDFKIGLKCLP